MGANADTITDFTLGAVGVGDVLVLSSAAFEMSVRGYSNYRSINGGAFNNSADNIIVDTLANISTVGAGGAGTGANYTQNRIAFDTTNRHWLYDADGNWSSGSIFLQSALITLPLVKFMDTRLLLSDCPGHCRCTVADLELAQD